MSKTITFEECNRIAAEAARRPTPINEETVRLTPFGDALVTVKRLRRQLAACEARDVIVLTPVIAELIVSAGRDGSTA